MAVRANGRQNDMLLPLLRTLAEEQVFLLEKKSKKFPFLHRGITRLIDPRGNTLGIVIDKQTLDALDEDLAAQSPKFLASLDASRKSGRVSAKAVKRRAGLL